MTTTIKSMEETIKALKGAGYKGKVFVGGAVLTKEYTNRIGADYYSKMLKKQLKLLKNFLKVDKEKNTTKIIKRDCR